MPAICQQYIQFIAWPDTRPRAKPVEDRDVSKVVMPDKYTYAFCYFELIEETVEINGEKVKLTSNRRKESPIYFYGAKIYSLEEYEKEKPAKNWDKILAFAKVNGWEKITILRTGEPLPYDDEMILVPSAG
ncbi:MAG: hypothetical protein WC878_05145 [Candidatus Paceibacterota bacterium]|jgi:hypothetical protein